MKKLVFKIFTLVIVSLFVGVCIGPIAQIHAFDTKSKTTWIVDKSGTEDFRTIQAAINGAESGDIILIMPGTYTEKLELNKALTLTGYHRTQSIIHPFDETQPFLISANNVIITNLTIEESTVNGIFVQEAQNLTLIDCNINSHHNAGIRLELCQNGLIKNNSFLSNNNAGVLVRNSENITVKDNLFVDQGVYGVWLLGSQDNYVNNNQIENTGKNGIRLESTSGNNISFNEVLDSDEQAINSDQGHFNEIYANILLRSQGDGISMKNSSYNVITANWLTLNEIGITFTSCCIHDNMIYHNNFVGNKIYQAYDSSGNTSWDGGAVLGGNYWSDYNYSDANGDGIGDMPYIIAGSARSQDRFPLMDPWVTYNPDDNTAPFPPTIIGDSQQQNDTLLYVVVSASDADDHDIELFVDWGDGSNSGWLGPFESGYELNVSHSWYLPGNYSVTAQARDEHGKLSEWSDPFEVTILPPPEYPELIFLEVNGGWTSLNITIYNRGRVDAQHVEYTVSTTHPYVLIGREHSGVIDTIPYEEGVDVSIKPIIGFGNAVFTLEAEATNNAYVSAEQSVYLFFIYLQILAQ